ncbi:uncharacterized protein LOC120189069 isoform X2 [Hibiscus syriacus]|uniref:uncharacterized protein LOC120189069 isoform X2 n=1 Tax=Hibiscus syriacus TaxID=106335 RepID=UPI001922CAB7|nr:uncharacterized protein LOC120189069 isoform X2 [Hibiscus syriacus]
MDNRGGSSVAVRRISHGLEQGNTCHSNSAEVVAGSAAWLGRGLSCVCAQRREGDARPSVDLTPSEEECLQRLQKRIDIAYDSSILEHQEALRALWNAAFPEEELRGLISEQWKEMGWQGEDPSTDFRGGGFISLENLLFFAREFPKSFMDLLWKQEGNRSAWGYPFAVAGVNITFMLIQMLDLEAVKPRTMVGAIFLEFLSDRDESHTTSTGKGAPTRRYNTARGSALVQSSYTIVERYILNYSYNAAFMNGARKDACYK